MMGRRALRLALAVLLGLAIGSGFMAENALHVHVHEQPHPRDADRLARAANASWHAVQIHAADGVVLAAWLFTPVHANGGGVVLLHGIDDSRTGAFGLARFLLDSGYAVLAPDSRGHGESGGPLVTYGILESEDVHRWATLLLREPGIQRLYGAGESMGAAILIQSLAREPRFRALAADCPFYDFADIAMDRLAQQGMAGRISSWPVVHLGFLYARLRYGLNLWDASAARALHASRTPVLLIHGAADTNIPPQHSRRLHAANPATTELWEVAGAEHVQSLAVQTQEYARRVTGFFAAHRD